MNPDDVQVLSLMVKAEKEAAKLMLEAHNILTENKSSSRDVVTEYDKRIEEFLRGQMLASLPEAKFLGEETEKDDAMSPCLFIIDPIDGTMNFVRGFHRSCISMAFARGGVVHAAAVYNPYLDEMFTAVKDGGAFLNGKKLQASDAALADSIVCIGTSPYDPDRTDRTFALARLAFDHSLDIRREGSAELDYCSVAAGRAGLYFECGLSIWDFAAGALIAAEAGAAVCTLDGTPMPYTGERSSAVAGSPAAIEEFFRLIKENNI